MENLPLEILTAIAATNYRVWRGMLSVRSFAEYTLTRECRSYVLRVFRRVKKIFITMECSKTYLCTDLHSFFDLPAIVYENGTSVWYRAGEVHRSDDLPAVVHPNGMCIWRRSGKYHREGDLPALIYSDGSLVWYRDDKLHRDGNLPAVITCYGTLEYWQNGKRLDIVPEKEPHE